MILCGVAHTSPPSCLQLVREEKRAQREQVSFCLGLVAINNKLEVRRDRKILVQDLLHTPMAESTVRRASKRRAMRAMRLMISTNKAYDADESFLEGLGGA